MGARHALGGVCYTYSYIVRPGVVQSGGENLIVFGELDNKHSERSNKLFEILDGVPGLSVENSPEIQKRIWKKFVWISSASAVGAVTRSPCGIWRAVSETRQLYATLLQEAFAVAATRGVSLGDGERAEIDKFMDARPEAFKTSMQRDIETGARSELMQQIGYTVRLGQEFGVSVPVSAAIYAALLPAELRAQGQIAYS